LYSPRLRPFFSYRSDDRISSGFPYPLGATWDGRGTNFALFSSNATKVELCLFDRSGRRELERIALPERTDDVWHVYVSDVGPGQLYGYRVHGPYAPERGFRFNAHKLLVDPYAKHLSGRLVWSDAHFGYRAGSPREDLSFDRRDNARGIPKACVIDEAFTWAGDTRPRIPWSDTIIYEAHVKGLTQQRDDVPPGSRGFFSGLAAPGVIDHLRRLGVTSVELLPVHAFVDDRHLTQRGLANYWGYNTLGFFASMSRYSSEGGIDEFRSVVSRLHHAGIEVILDVVFNHTAEGNHLGPTLSFRGIDNTSYYWLLPDKPRYYDDFTGCGNALNLTHPRVLQLVMDSLRYWCDVFHIDGFRFDLASTLGRAQNGFDGGASFFAAIRQDPTLAQVKLIAEPWDIGLGGYQVGQFPSGWSEWNDKFRQTLRKFWIGEPGQISDLSKRMVGSPDLYKSGGRRPYASINHITVHDGFTLADLVSYSQKHNEANGEENRDGSDENFSTNCGVEGPTDDESILSQRSLLRKNLLSSLMLAQGVPLVLAGDEVGNSQGGNNNAYCQDNATGWVDWSGAGVDGQDLTDLVASLGRIRQLFPQFRSHSWAEAPGKGLPWVRWFTPQGTEMTEADWNFPEARFLAYVLGPAMEGGSPVLLVLNAAPDQIEILMPEIEGVTRWSLLLNTAAEEQREIGQQGSWLAAARSVSVFAGES
jgi:isoamylase